MLVNLDDFLDDFMGFAAVSLHSSLKYRRNWNKNGPTVQLLRKFMPRGSKGFRLYLPIGAQSSRVRAVAPLQVRHAVQQAGFRITDYLAKKCVKLSDKEQKNEFNIGKVIAKDPVAKAAFDNDPQLQNSSTSEFTMVVSCHPYDIIGMSTGRSWDNESCMRLADNREMQTDGINKHYLERDVAEGTLVAYAIRTADTNIEKPLGRCLLKPFLKEDGEDILYRRETKIYGNPVPGFADSLQRFLRRLNAGVPAGMYRLNERLYNDGVGGRHTQEDSNEGHTENGVDWSMVDDDAKLSERPDLFPSFAAYMISKHKEGLTDSDAVIHILLSKADGIPTQFCKQAGRLIASNKDMVVSFVGATTVSYDGAENAKRFMKSKELRAAIVDHAGEYKSWITDSDAATLISKKYAHNYFVKMDKTSDAYWDAGHQLLEGNLDIPTKDIESIPEFHKIVYFLATLTREASAFDYEKNQETAHKLLTVLTPIDIKMDETLMEQFKKFLRHYKDEYRVPAAALILNLIKNGQDEFANTVGMTMSSAGFIYAMRMRKFHRRFLALKTLPQGLHLLVTNSVAALMDNHAGNDEAVARDLYTILKRMPYYDALRADNYYGIIRVNPDLYGTLYYSSFKGNPADIDKAIYQVPNIQHCHDVQARGPKTNFKALNISQESMWELHGTLLHLDTEMHSEIMVDYSPDTWLSKISDMKDGLRNLGNLNIDLTRFPQFLNADTAKRLSPAQFINGVDNGFTVVDTLAKQGLYALAEAVEHVFKEDPMQTMVNTFTDIHTLTPEVMLSHIRRLLNQPTITDAQEFYDQCDGFVQVVEKFVKRMSPEKGEGFPERFAAAVDLPLEQVMEEIVAIPPMIQALDSYLQGAKGAMGAFTLFSKGSELKINPSYAM